MSAKRTEDGYPPVSLSKEQVELLSAQEFPAPVYVDLSSKRSKDDETRGEFRDLLREKFDLNLSDKVERIWQLPSVVLKRGNDEYVRLLIEARDLFVMGFFYSCVAMCGIVGEKLVKDLVRDSVFLPADEAGNAKRPPNEAFDQLERVDASALVRFLNKAKLLSDEAEKAARELAELRNQYAHARGKNPQADALKSIQKLHLLLEETVSVLKDHEFVDGQLVPRTEIP